MAEAEKEVQVVKDVIHVLLEKREVIAGFRNLSRKLKVGNLASLRTGSYRYVI